MKVAEFIEAVNNGKFNSLWEVEDEIENCPKAVATGLDPDNHRWYIVSTNVYECEDGFVGVTGCSMLKSEMMSWKDAMVETFASEYEAVQTITYKPKK